jgi:tRNA (cmo5U34)-methyltransferase
VAQFHWDPDTYLKLVREEVPDYEHLQEEAVAATGTGTGTGGMRVLELGIGTGETARRVLARHPTASLIGLDASREMVDQARRALPDDRVQLRVAHLEDPLPDGPFDVVISTLAIHHLDGRGKAKLFQRAARVIAPGGRLVVADIVVPEDPSDVVTPIDNCYDTPSSIAEQLNWLAKVGLEPSPATRFVLLSRDFLGVYARSYGDGGGLDAYRSRAFWAQMRTCSRLRPRGNEADS